MCVCIFIFLKTTQLATCCYASRAQDVVFIPAAPPSFTTRRTSDSLMAAARMCTSASVGGGLFLLISLLYIRFILRVGPLGPFDAVIEPPEPPLCLLTGGPALVVALPLLEQTAAAASAALAERLEQWQGMPPCRRDDGAATLSLVLAWSGAALVDAQASAGPQLQRRAAELLRTVRHCLGEPELLDGRAIRAHLRSRWRSGAARRRAATASVEGAAASSAGNAPAARLRLRLPVSSTLRENALFLAVLAHARRRGAALLWLSPHTTPLRPRWLEVTLALPSPYPRPTLALLSPQPRPTTLSPRRHPRPRCHPCPRPRLRPRPHLHPRLAMARSPLLWPPP